jgi:hypothetical protein
VTGFGCLDGDQVVISADVGGSPGKSWS